MTDNTAPTPNPSFDINAEHMDPVGQFKDQGEAMSYIAAAFMFVGLSLDEPFSTIELLGALMLYSQVDHVTDEEKEYILWSFGRRAKAQATLMDRRVQTAQWN